MTSTLEDRLRRQIAAAGPVSVADFMSACLLDPEGGYYTTGEPFGVSGDFTTAPEISQMFGEIVAAWLIHAWRVIGQPDPFVLAEIGPGRGTLMMDILRTTAIDPAFLNAAHIHLVEVSPRLRSVQGDTLAKHVERCTWSSDIGGLPDHPALIVANELFDAIPFRQFQKAGGAWRERRIGIGADGAFVFGLGATGLDPRTLPAGAEDQPEGAIFEYAPAREAFAARIGGRLADRGGAALVIDYGHAAPGFGDTFQALAGHRPVDVFDRPGHCDLTSHVDFAALARAASNAGANAMPIITQGEFLLALGLAERAGALGAGKDAAAQSDIAAAAQRLAGSAPGQMGSLFKVLCLTGRPMVLPPFV